LSDFHKCSKKNEYRIERPRKGQENSRTVERDWHYRGFLYRVATPWNRDEPWKGSWEIKYHVENPGGLTPLAQ
jgi:hypothetical protein